MSPARCQALRHTLRRLPQHVASHPSPQLHPPRSLGESSNTHKRALSTASHHSSVATSLHELEKRSVASRRSYSRLPNSSRGSRVGRRAAQQATATQRSFENAKIPPRDDAHETSRSDPQGASALQDLGQRQRPTEPAVPLPSDPGGVLSPQTHPAVATMLGQEAVICTREVEWMNIMVGFEQANRYALLNPSGQPLGYLVEQEGSLGKTLTRQLLRTHRPFKALVLAPNGTPILRVERSFTFINSRTRVYSIDPGTYDSAADVDLERAPDESDEQLIGEVRQVWHPFKRRYEIFRAREGGQEMQQVAKVDGAFLTWDFFLEDESGKVVGSVNRNFRGFARELFADVGQYVVRFEGDTPASGTSTNNQSPVKAENESRELVPITPSLTLDERALALCGLAFGLDVDYFSRHSSSGYGGFFPGFMPIPMGGGGSQPPTETPGQTSGSGTGGEPTPSGGAGTDVWQDTRGLQSPQLPPGAVSGESAVGTAGTVAGYEAWSGWMTPSSTSDSPAPAQPVQGASPPPPQDYTGSGQGYSGRDENVWGDQDPWKGGDENSGGGLFGDIFSDLGDGGDFFDG
ncbi:Phospholipid scramblase [Ceraceosorus bombacis]|uniref:Phospholipid scramblase n=1 Tax=Ceraceosorus bombacis TaxID=401625 RepID=A0A0P1BNA8_9BASI|nr:Phospholipid scramblase [Ceraceosorus bombacis]